MPAVRPSPVELFLLLGVERGYHRVEVDGEVCWIPVDDVRRFERLVRGGTRVRVGLVPFHERHCATARSGCALWVVADTPARRAAVVDYEPRPTVRIAEGATVTAVWALERPLPVSWVRNLNRRLAVHLGCVQKHGQVWQDMGVPGSWLGRGRLVEAHGWTGELHSARAVAGNLADPPDPKAAWKAMQAA